MFENLIKEKVKKLGKTENFNYRIWFNFPFFLDGWGCKAIEVKISVSSTATLLSKYGNTEFEARKEIPSYRYGE